MMILKPILDPKICIYIYVVQLSFPSKGVVPWDAVANWYVVATWYGVARQALASAAARHIYIYIYIYIYICTKRVIDKKYEFLYPSKSSFQILNAIN